MADNNDNADSGRSYIVLMHQPEGTFRQVAIVNANGPAQAGRRAARQIDDGMLEQGVELIAIPERNWAEIKIKLERQSSWSRHDRDRHHRRRARARRAEPHPVRAPTTPSKCSPPPRTVAEALKGVLDDNDMVVRSDPRAGACPSTSRSTAGRPPARCSASART